MVYSRAHAQVTDKTDDVEVLSCGLAASDVLYPPLQNAEDGASAEAASGDAAAGTGDASVQVEADGSSKSSSSSSPSFNDKLTALGNALGLSLTTEFDATLSQAIEKLPLKPPTPEAAAAAEETPSEAVADEATKAAPTTSAANAAQVALEEMATELAQELKKTAMLGEMTKAAAEDASHRGGSASKPR
jgi:pyruvate/2-oxoglutarate dehydrogenase complex dihydrolipoamide acyltransferase (E2) component